MLRGAKRRTLLTSTANKGEDGCGLRGGVARIGSEQVGRRPVLRAARVKRGARLESHMQTGVWGAWGRFLRWKGGTRFASSFRTSSAPQ